jgi:hypothetical protein
MRGHGDAVVGASRQVAIFRAIYTEVNANLQLQATMLGGPITFLNQYESKKPAGDGADLGGLEAAGLRAKRYAPLRNSTILQKPNSILVSLPSFLPGIERDHSISRRTL